MELGLVVDLTMESFGEPGQRTFRVAAATAEGTVSLWLEKEQVVMLGTAIEELLEHVPKEDGDAPEPIVTSTFVGDMEVKVGSLAIAYDPAQRGFTVEATDFVSALGLTSIGLLATREQFIQMNVQIDDIVAGSRPRCVLCGRPLAAEGHFCPESNGHSSTVAE